VSEKPSDGNGQSGIDAPMPDNGEQQVENTSGEGYAENVLHLMDDLNSGAFAAAGIAVPKYSQQAEAEQTPVWLHIGPGNFFRAVHTHVAQDLMNAGELSGGIALAGVRSPATITDVYRPYANRHLSVVMPVSGPWRKEVVASVTHSYLAHEAADWAQLRAIASNPALQLVTLTITEKGYTVVDPGTPTTPKDAMGVVTALLFARFLAGKTPLALLATDNFSRNGDVFRASVLKVAGQWKETGLVSQDFISWIDDRTQVSFPLSMVDRITPNPAQGVADKLAAEGFGDTELIRTSASTVMAPFANTEEVWYLVLEDDFPNGRPAFEKAGVLLGEREMVNAADEMKVTVCLNPLHTAMSIYGCLLGYTRIYAEMQDAEITALIRKLGYDEGLPVSPDPKIISPKAFLDELLTKRLPNPNLPDAPQRIAADTSQKLPIRIGETVKKYLAGPGLGSLVAVPLTLAGWLRYLMAVDDEGKPMELSPDPLLAELTRELGDLQLGSVSDEQALRAANLLDAVLKVKLPSDFKATIASYLVKLASGPGAVRATLHNTLNN
jgi:fructuronate reductase